MPRRRADIKLSSGSLAICPFLWKTNYRTAGRVLVLLCFGRTDCITAETAAQKSRLRKPWTAQQVHASWGWKKGASGAKSFGSDTFELKLKDIQCAARHDGDSVAIAARLGCDSARRRPALCPSSVREFRCSEHTARATDFNENEELNVDEK